MINSAASLLVHDDSVTSVDGRTDLAYFGSDPNQDDRSEDFGGMKSRLASLSISSESNAPVKRPSVVITNQFPEQRDIENPQDMRPAQGQKTKRQLPMTPKSLYSSPAGSQASEQQSMLSPKSPERSTALDKPQKSPKAKKSSTEKEPKRKITNNVSMDVSTDLSSPSSPELPDKPANRQLLFNQTHIAGYKFVARHPDEINLEVGDPICVSKMHEDLWYEGTNIRTGKTGIFPSRYVSDILRNMRTSSTGSLGSTDDNQFFLRFLGSVEVSDFKGNEIMCDAMRKIVKQHQLTSMSRPPQCTLEVNPRGIKIVEHQNHGMSRQQPKRQSKRKLGKLFDKEHKQTSSSATHFFSLKNVTFCGCHPTNARFFAFITKHPEEHRFACHVFMSEYSTEPVAYAVGLAFKAFYAEFMDFQAPAEDFYIE